MFLKERLHEGNELITDLMLLSVSRVKVAFPTLVKITGFVLAIFNTSILLSLSLNMAISIILLDIMIYAWFFRRLGYVLFIEKYDCITEMELSKSLGSMKVKASFINR